MPVLAPSRLMQAADEAWLARYIMARVCEEYGVSLSFDPKPVANADGEANRCRVEQMQSSPRRRIMSFPPDLLAHDALSCGLQYDFPRRLRDAHQCQHSLHARPGHRLGRTGEVHGTAVGDA